MRNYFILLFLLAINQANCQTKSHKIHLVKDLPAPLFDNKIELASGPKRVRLYTRDSLEKDSVFNITGDSNKIINADISEKDNKSFPFYFCTKAYRSDTLELKFSSPGKLAPILFLFIYQKDYSVSFSDSYNTAYSDSKWVLQAGNLALTSLDFKGSSKVKGKIDITIYNKTSKIKYNYSGFFWF